MNRLEKIVLGFVFLISVIFQIHNISLYNPDFGFDGKDHQAYISYIFTNHKLPLPNVGWESTQTPLYYTFGALFKAISANPQYLNLFVFILLTYIFYRYTNSFIATFAFLSLPMANYLVPQISNELMSGMWIVLCLFLIIKIPNIKTPQFCLKHIILSALVISIGFYTKYTALSLIPVLVVALFLSSHLSVVQKTKFSVISGALVLLLISPVLIRNYILQGKPFLLAPDFTVMGGESTPRNFSFFTRLDWITKVDIYNAHKYSFLGGLWNTYWHDGEHSITPVVAFHKKAFSLWLLGFPLFFMSLVGLAHLFKTNKKTGIVLLTYLLIGLGTLVQYNIYLPYDYVLKAFYAFGVIVPYTFGLSEFSKIGKWQRRLSILLLITQYFLMLSYFWIQPWWHVVK